MKPYFWTSLDLRHLVALQAIAETGSFWAAADRLDCAASGLSQQIATLERTIGHRVLDRSRGRRRAQLTEPGRLLLRHASAIAAHLQAAAADLAAYAEGGAGSLRIGTFQSVGTKVLPRLLREFSAEWPNVELSLAEESALDHNLELVERGELDLAFAVLPVPRPSLESVELMRDPYRLMVSAASPLASVSRLDSRHLRRLRMIGPHGSHSTGQVEAILLAFGIRPNFVFRSDDNSVVQALVGAGLGASLSPMLTINEPDDAIRLLELPGAPARTIGLCWHRDRYRTPAAAAFTEHARRICTELAATAPGGSG